MEDQVAQFMARRPYYSESHVREIAATMSGSLFCGQCADWHDADLECSDSE